MSARSDLYPAQWAYGRPGIGPIELVVASTVAATALCMNLAWGADVPVDQVAFAAVLALLAAYDLRQGIIPNRLVMAGLVAALVAALMVPNASLIGSLTGAGVFAAPYLVALALWPQGQGAGDVKLALFAGAVVGMPGAASAMVVALCAAGVISIVLAVTRGRRAVLPVGLSIATGAVFAMV